LNSSRHVTEIGTQVAILCLLILSVITHTQANLTLAVSQNKTEDRTVYRSTENQGFLFANQISVFTDKQSYELRDNISITIKNLGVRPVHLLGINSDIKIVNLKNNESFTIPSVLLDSVIPAGSSKSITWNQQDFTGQQAKFGQYAVIVTVGSLKANTTFALSTR
jgi:hypothetical protein